MEQAGAVWQHPTATAANVVTCKKSSGIIVGRISSVIGVIGDQSGMNDVGGGIGIVGVDVGAIDIGDLFESLIGLRDDDASD